MSWVNSIQELIYRGRLDQARKELKQAPEGIRKELFEIQFLIMANDYDQALSRLSKKKTELDPQSAPTVSLWTLIQEAIIHMRLGNYREAKSAISLADVIVGELDDVQRRLSIYHLISYYRTRGNFNLLQSYMYDAIEDYLKSRALLQELNLNTSVAGINHNLGMIYSFLGQLETAEEYFKLAMDVWRQEGNPKSMAYGLEKLVINQIKKGYRDKAKEYLDEFALVIEGTNDKLSHMFFHYATGFYYKTSPRLSHKVKAQESFRQVVNEKVMDHFTTMQATLSLCEILIDEFRITPNSEVIEELELYSKQIKEMANEFKSLNFIFDFLLIQADFAQLQGDLTLANQYIDEAITLVTGTDLDHLVKRGLDKKQQLIDNMEKLRLMAEQMEPLFEKLELIRLKEYIQDVSEFVQKGSKNSG